MNIEELNERIKQLTEFVASTSDTIKKAEEMIKLAEQERDRLCDQYNDSEPKFERVEKYRSYWSLTFDGAVYSSECTEHGENCYDDNANYESNNYFKTVQRAEEIADKINFLLKLERLHDTFCPDFNLGLGDGLDVEKYYVYYNFVYEKWMNSCMIHASSAVQVYFPTEEIAQKVCDILNKEDKE